MLLIRPAHARLFQVHTATSKQACAEWSNIEQSSCGSLLRACRQASRFVRCSRRGAEVPRTSRAYRCSTGAQLSSASTRDDLSMFFSMRALPTAYLSVDEKCCPRQSEPFPAARAEQLPPASRARSLANSRQQRRRFRESSSSSSSSSSSRPDVFRHARSDRRSCTSRPRSLALAVTRCKRHLCCSGQSQLAAACGQATPS